MDLELKKLSIEELNTLLKSVEAELESRTPAEGEVVTLEYNQYKGTGKCWIAIVDEKTLEKRGWVDAKSVQKNGYKGTKIFMVPLKEGTCYQFNEAGSKSQDCRYFRKVVNRELVSF